MLTNKILKVTAIWAAIVYIACVLIAWLLPSIYTWGAGNLIHFGMVVSEPALKLSGVVQGLIIWEIVVLVVVWLFVWLYKKFN